MKDSQHNSLRSADTPPIGLDIRPDREEMVRRIEKNINTVWARWCDDFSDRTPHEVLAMVTYQYAKLYYELVERVEANEESITDFEKFLDDALHHVS